MGGQGRRGARAFLAAQRRVHSGQKRDAVLGGPFEPVREQAGHVLGDQVGFGDVQAEVALWRGLEALPTRGNRPEVDRKSTGNRSEIEQSRNRSGIDQELIGHRLEIDQNGNRSGID